MSIRTVVLFAALALQQFDCTVTTLFNTKLPYDTRGKLLITGESDAIQHNGKFYFYFNNWGTCNGIDCCPTSGGCASCCFTHLHTCVYGKNHSVVVYETSDLSTWIYRGEALPLSSRLPGTEFRPHVIFNKLTNKFVMWYEDRHPGQQGYAVAVADTPVGPFKTIENSIKMHGHGRSDGSGDFALFVDDDGTAYHVRDGFVIEKLNASYTGVTPEVGYLHTPKPSEGPVFFKRNGLYYILAGTGCCACKGGSSIYVFTATNPLGPYQYRGDVGRNTTTKVFNKHSPYNYITRAQASLVLKLPPATDETGAVIGQEQFIWMGNQWVTAQEKGHPRNHDLLYWYPLEFKSDNSIAQVRWQDKTVVHV
eukprot:TRINITY_DN75911_c0_g1_i1.p1 TRINITY_DN75911_c0_g1~~TRINITY_DN75911_c0_g1_i1.p1  ORF type:complete len:365 (-),score=34.84 TRINITY_DN75911_c0_g1_i1:55-1149(-)